MRAWEPEGPFEERLSAAFAAGDTTLCLALLAHADLAVPVTPAAAAGREPAGWPVAADDERTWILAYTSVPAMRAATGGTEHFRPMSLAEMAACWPDPRWGLAVNAGLPAHFFLAPGAVARLAVPTLAQDRAAAPDSGVPVLQKLLRRADLRAFLGAGETRVSGYCHHALDVAHIATPAVLADTAGRPDCAELLSDHGSVFILRWYAVGLNLYPTPYGGVDEAGRAAVDGWVVEEPPFTGLGLAPHPDRLVREYKPAAVGLPHGSEIWELADDGTERRRAFYDGDTGRWMLVRRAAAPVTGDGLPGGADVPGTPVATGTPPAGFGQRSGALPGPPGTALYQARWRGADHPAVPDQRADGLWLRLWSAEPAAGFTQVRPGHHVRPVPAAECAAVSFTPTVAEWRGAPFAVLGERAGELLLEYTGGSVLVARELGLDRAGRGVHRRRVPRHEVRNVRTDVVPLDL
ncbi:hypothetical protein Sru01_33380 [Sphaerisporangium rufum]|uniref:SseB protein N-terminal domain-containing protein n=1 Tax=Sphaerisporangium rufum TaxID=1381558 RepID=A0A919UYT1_9ACTN|nr:SseB family protein [Sphaerisporangium rufum]GII78356.1 hypothetical protein Sru01_33380 [Sphaerisporangium rufum]